MVIKEYLNMKSILKYLLTNRIVILSVFNLAVVFWIVWYEGHIQYEPLLELERGVLTEMGLPTVPLNEVIYNTIIATFAINMTVLVLELRRIRKRKMMKSDLSIAFTYFSLIMFCMLFGCLYISSRTHNDIINEYNSLFRFPIWIIGKDMFTSVVTVTRLYMSLCVIHLCISLFYIYYCIYRLVRMGQGHGS